MSGGGSKRRPDGPGNQSARGRYTPREEAQKDKATLVPQYPKCHKAYPKSAALGTAASITSVERKVTLREILGAHQPMQLSQHHKDA